MLYLDNAASTKLHKEVLDEMLNSLEAYGNSEAKFYIQAEQAKKLIALARARVARLVNSKDSEIVFTSGATESNNMVLKGIFFASSAKKKRIVISSVEHSSVYDTCKYLETLGAEIVIIPVDREGNVDLEALENAVDSHTIVVSVLYVNNEIGTIQNLEAIDKICLKHNTPFHTDATQAVGKTPVDFSRYRALKFMTFTGHKLYGPKGIGCLVCREDSNGEKPRLAPLLHGGEQESGLRAGTLPTPLIVGFGKACEIAKRDLAANDAILRKNEEIVLCKLKMKFGTRLVLNNDFGNRIPGLLNVRFCGYNNVILLKALSSHIAASTGSACAVSHPSRILKKIGLSEAEINESIRLSLSAYEEPSSFDALDLL